MAYESPDRDPEIRRRAAWLLAMLALVAGLLVLVFVVFLDGGNDQSDIADNGAGPTPPPAATSAPASSSDPDPSSSATPSGGSSDSSSASSTTPPPGGPVSCPGSERCKLTSDVGNAIEAVNAYRVDHGKDPVPGKVTTEAVDCASSDGSDCSGGWSQTSLPLDGDKADGQAAVDKVKTRGKLLQDMKSFGVGWAFDPGSKTLYFAVIRLNS